MNLDKWKESSILTKVGTVCELLSAVIGLILGFMLADEIADAFSMFPLPFDLEGILIVFLIVYYGIDIIVFFGLLHLKKWARTLTIWWGIGSVLAIVMQIKNPTAIFISYILGAVAAVCLLLAGNDFKKDE